MDYILHELKGAKNVLSIGCGPAIIEAGLAEHGFNITGLDISRKALEEAPDNIRTVVGSAEHMDFADDSFDAVIYIASLQFIENYKRAIKRTACITRHNGKLLVMLLNPKSWFFREKINNPASYVSKIKHTDIKEIEKTIAEYFSVKTEYFLGIREREIFESQNPESAGLYIIKGEKRLNIRQIQTANSLRTKKPGMF